MSLWSINQLVEFVRGQVARGRERFGFVAENGDIFRVDPAEDENGVVVRQENGVFGVQLCERDPMEEYEGDDAWGQGHDPGDEHQY